MYCCSYRPPVAIAFVTLPEKCSRSSRESNFLQDELQQRHLIFVHAGLVVEKLPHPILLPTGLVA